MARSSSSLRLSHEVTLFYMQLESFTSKTVHHCIYATEIKSDVVTRLETLQLRQGFRGGPQLFCGGADVHAMHGGRIMPHQLHGQPLRYA